jgi:iron complex outermembrane receptor protein
MKHFIHYCIAIICSIIVTNVCAQEADTSSINVLEEQLLRSNNEHHSLQSHTLDITYLGKNSLLRQQGNTFINTLEKIPGLSAINTGVGISKPVIRGMSLNRVIVTENGLKQEGQQWGVDHGLEIDQYAVDRVEILKGPVSVMYGSDGIGGVINILPPLIPSKNSLKGEIITNYKSNNDLLTTSAKLSYNKNDIYTIARGTIQSFSSYKVPASSFKYNGYILPIYENRLKNTGGQEINFQVTQGIRKKWGQSSITFSNVNQLMGFFVGAFGAPRSHNLEHDGNFRNINNPKQSINHFKIINNSHIHLPNGKLEWELGYQSNVRKEIADTHSHDLIQKIRNSHPSDASLYLHLQTLQLNSRWTKEWQDVKNVVGFSTSYQNNTSGGDEFLIPSYNQVQIGAYDYLEYQINPKLLLASGLRIDYVHQNSNATIADYYKKNNTLDHTDTLSPKLKRNYFNTSFSVGLKYQPNVSRTYKINLGTAYRTPTMNELLSNGVHHGTFRHEKGATSLKEEKGIMFDLGIKQYLGKLEFDITPFVNYFTNYLYLRPTGSFSNMLEAGQIYQYAQAEAVFLGFEASASYPIFSNLTCNTDLEYVWNQQLDQKLSLPMTPPLSWRSDISYYPFKHKDKLSAFFINVEAHIFGAQNNTYINEPTTNGYTLINAALSYSIPYNKQGKISIYLQLRNMTNSIYMNNMSRYRILNLPEQGRNFQCLVRWEF